MHTHSIEEFRHDHDHSGSTEHHEARVSLVTATPKDAGFYRQAILSVSNLAHLTVEVQRCPDHEAAA
jgi:hypothetical protein